jgi:hypothetical protein
MKTPIRRTPKLKDNMIFFIYLYNINIKRNPQKKNNYRNYNANIVMPKFTKRNFTFVLYIDFI